MEWLGRYDKVEREYIMKSLVDVSVNIVGCMCVCWPDGGICWLCAYSGAADASADGAAEGDKADEQAPADGANDSVATADLTIDSVKVHLR